MRIGWLFACLAAAAATAPGGAEAAGRKPPDNPANDYLLRLPPEKQAEWLAHTVGGACIATDPFPMGVATTGRAAGNAYWSFRCAGDGSYVVQIDRRGRGVTIDCETFNANGGGKKCFEKI